jgi:hypothetical protein
MQICENIKINLIINNLGFFSFCLFFYFIGILIKYLNYNIFESHLFSTFFTIFGFMSSNLLIIFDEINPYTTLTNLNNLNYKKKWYYLFLVYLFINF